MNSSRLQRRRWLAGAAVAGLLACGLAGLAAGSAPPLAAEEPAAPRAKPDAGKRAKRNGKDSLRYLPSYEAAMLEARVRGVPIFFSRHKDGCGRCERQKASVFGTSAFRAWAAKHVVVLFAHNERGHEEDRATDAEGRETRSCTLYPGLSCRDHLDIAVQTQNAREEHLPRVPFLELCPNSWLIAPWLGLASGTGSDAPTSAEHVVPIAESDQFSASGIETATATLQKRLGEALSYEEAQPLVEALAASLAHAEEERLGHALAALVPVGRLGARLPRSLVHLLDERLAAIDEEATWRMESLLESSDEAERRAGLAALEAELDIEVAGKRLPVLATLKARPGR